MGQKINAYRILSKQYLENSFHSNKKEYAVSVCNSMRIRKYFDDMSLKRQWKVVRIHITKFADKIQIEIISLFPGIITGKQGKNIQNILKDLKDKVKINSKIDLLIKGVASPETSATSIAIKLAGDLQARKSPAISIKKHIVEAMSYGAKGILIQLKGRIGGRAIARTMRESRGEVPRQTLRVMPYIDYKQYDVHTDSGLCGLKVLVNNYNPKTG